LLLGLSPDSNALVSTHSNEVVANARHSETPDSSEKAVEGEDLFVGVTVDHFDFTVLGGSEDIVSVSDKFHAGYAVLVQEKTLVNITELHSPDLEIFISGSSGQKGAVTGDVEGEDRQFVTIEVQ